MASVLECSILVPTYRASVRLDHLLRQSVVDVFEVPTELRRTEWYIQMTCARRERRTDKAWSAARLRDHVHDILTEPRMYHVWDGSV